ncbi:hypothetical protein [Nocardia sp. NPDC019395]|uniref:hypothetical protein n=1 Tax=Nocardia sp. NPDC019395 TaxID=3154686 RepID=UPI00340396AA
MWHWTTRTGQFPEAVAFTRVTEPEPTITEPVSENEETETGEPEYDAIRYSTSAMGFDLAG